MRSSLGGYVAMNCMNAGSKDMMGFTAKFPSPDGKHAVVVEDDGRVGYAYLLDSKGTICGDVWLYNRSPAPEEPEWSHRQEAPLANPAFYVDACQQPSLPNSVDDISLEWRCDKGLDEAKIFIHRELAAKLVDGAKPGWSALAKRDGPLARAFEK